MLDTNHRFFTDDISFGLCIAEWIAHELGVEVPRVEEVIGWAQEMREEASNARSAVDPDSDRYDGDFSCGLPSAYGITDVDGVID